MNLIFVYDSELRTIADKCSHIAVDMLEGLPSDHLAAWVLEQSPGGKNGENSAVLAVALRSKNQIFVKSARLNRVINFWWCNNWYGFFEKYNYIPGQYPSGNFNLNLFERLLSNPRIAFEIPKVTYLIKVNYKIQNTKKTKNNNKIQNTKYKT